MEQSDELKDIFLKRDRRSTEERSDELKDIFLKRDRRSTEKRSDELKDIFLKRNREIELLSLRSSQPSSPQYARSPKERHKE